MIGHSSTPVARSHFNAGNELIVYRMIRSITVQMICAGHIGRSFAVPVLGHFLFIYVASTCLQSSEMIPVKRRD